MSGVVYVTKWIFVCRKETFSSMQRLSDKSSVVEIPKNAKNQLRIVSLSWPTTKLQSRLWLGMLC